MPRKSRAKETTIAEVLDANPSIMPAAELPDPALPTFAEKLAQRDRPTGPRKRDGEPAASFASEDLRIIKDGNTWQLRAERELTGNEKDRLAASGFQAVDDNEQIWNATQRELTRRETDINHVAMALGKQQGRGR